MTEVIQLRGKQFIRKVDNYKSKMELKAKVASLVLGILSLPIVIGV